MSEPQPSENVCTPSSDVDPLVAADCTHSDKAEMFRPYEPRRFQCADCGAESHAEPSSDVDPGLYPDSGGQALTVDAGPLKDATSAEVTTPDSGPFDLDAHVRFLTNERKLLVRRCEELHAALAERDRELGKYATTGEWVTEYGRRILDDDTTWDEWPTDYTWSEKYAPVAGPTPPGAVVTVIERQRWRGPVTPVQTGDTND